MLRKIISITGKPGLYKIISHSANRIIAESLVDGKRFPVSARDRIISLGDIAMYTDGDDKPLGEILDLVYTHNEGKTFDAKNMPNAELAEAFAAILPNFDRERVYPTDIKKLFAWYNMLLSAGFTRFTEEATPSEDKATEEEKK